MLDHSDNTAARYDAAIAAGDLTTAGEIAFGAEHGDGIRTIDRSDVPSISGWFDPDETQFAVADDVIPSSSPWWPRHPRAARPRHWVWNKCGRNHETANHDDYRFSVRAYPCNRPGYKKLWVAMRQSPGSSVWEMLALEGNPPLLFKEAATAKALAQLVQLEIHPQTWTGLLLLFIPLENLTDVEPLGVTSDQIGDN
jgi:hypothetical protein